MQAKFWLLENIELARKFNLLGKLLELHGENPFKTRSYTNAYLTIKKWPDKIIDLPTEELASIKGIGKAIQAKIRELADTGEMKTLNRYLSETPEGIIEMIGIKGFGPKKIAVIWKELEIETVGELLYAINENRLKDVKGFGEKTQANLKTQLEYHLDSADKLLYPIAQRSAAQLLSQIEEVLPEDQHTLIGQIARKCSTIELIEILTTSSEPAIEALCQAHPDISYEENRYRLHRVLLQFTYVSKKDFILEQVRLSSDPEFWKKLKIKKQAYTSEAAVFEDNKLPHYIPEYREKENLEHLSSYPGDQNIITQADLKGCIHNHSTYSDGLQTVSQMLEAALDRSYEYFVITDHSKSAIYANGLNIDRLYMQLDEIRKLDQEESEIKLFSGTESDILANGNLDYPDEVLADLDLIVASIHSSLKMDKAKATKRLITAVENPFTSILGHPTGRLLLSRPGYPIDTAKVIDACADNNVAIELNANPNRLDMDWRWINYAISKGVLISINPDAHSIKGLDDSQYGVAAARKAGLPIAYCLNAMDLDEFEEWLEEQHAKRPT